jgi:3-dehydroquinate synthase
MKKINLSLPNKEIPFFVGPGIENSIKKELSKIGITDNIFIVVDRKVYRLFKEKIDSISTSFDKSYILKFTANEKNKNFAGVEKIYNSLLRKRFGRDATLIAIGGGVVGDTAGFAASTFSRGINLVHIPTTLLAAVDSSIGGKTGINYNETKNIVGSFYQPEAVFIDVEFLTTLDSREFVSGLGEVIKYGFLTDGKLFEYVSRNLNRVFDYDIKILNKIISESVNFKINVVEVDEKESGLRQILNLGHTFAHAFEIEMNYQLRHGEAVLAGIMSAIILSEKLGLLNAGLKGKYFRFLAKLDQINFSLGNIDENKCYSIMQHDKKNRNGKIRFVLPIDFGQFAIGVEAGKRDVISAIRETKALFK